MRAGPLSGSQHAVCVCARARSQDHRAAPSPAGPLIIPGRPVPGPVRPGAPSLGGLSGPATLPGLRVGPGKSVPALRADGSAASGGGGGGRSPLWGPERGAPTGAGAALRRWADSGPPAGESRPRSRGRAPSGNGDVRQPETRAFRSDGWLRELAMGACVSLLPRCRRAGIQRGAVRLDARQPSKSKRSERCRYERWDCRGWNCFV